MAVESGTSEKSYAPGALMATEALTGLSYLDPDELVVELWLDGATERSAVLERDVDYEIAGDGAANPPTGTIAALDTYAAGDRFRIYRDGEATQPEVLPKYEPLPAKDVERGLDRMMLRVQEVKRDLLRAVRFPAFSSGYELPPIGAALGVLGYDEDGVFGVLDGETLRGQTGAPGGNVLAVGLFDAVSGMTVPAGTNVIATTGYNAINGLAAALYVSDALADAALAATHPRFCKADAVGKYFRLIPDDENLIPVACGGAYGQATAITNGSTDDQPAIQAAIYYANSVGAAGIRLDARNYALRRQGLTPGETIYDPRLRSGVYAVLLRCRAGTIYKSTHPLGSDLWRRDTNGTAMTNLSFDLGDGGAWVWRGGGIWVDGVGTLGSADPGIEACASLTLDGVRIQGGLLTTGNGTWPANTTTGDGWDLTDKGIWQANDQHSGHLTFKNAAGVIGFRGELTYLSGTIGSNGIGTDIAKRYFTVEDGCVLGEGNATCLNAGGHTVRVGKAILYNSIAGVELHTGEFGGYCHARMFNMSGGVGVFWGGIVNWTGVGLYHVFTRPFSGNMPLFELDLYVHDCGLCYLGSALTGRIVAVDTEMNIGDTSAMSECKSTDLEIISYVDKVSLNAGAYITSAAQTTANLSIRLHMKRTANAVANSFKHNTAVFNSGSFGPDVRVDVATFERPDYANVTGGVPTTNFPIVTIDHFDETYAIIEYDIEANAGGTLPYNVVLSLRCANTATGGYTLSLPTAGVGKGAEMWLWNVTPSYVAGGVALRIPGSQFRDGKDRVIPASYALARVRYNGTKWEWVEGINELTGSTTWNPGSIANGAQETTTVMVKGAALGDRAEVTLSVSTGGLVLTGAVTAANTVTATLSNTSGAAVDLANATLTATVRA